MCSQPPHTVLLWESHVAGNSRTFLNLHVRYMTRFSEFYIRGSVHRESNLTIFQLDATYSVYYITVGSSTCLGC